MGTIDQPGRVHKNMGLVVSGLPYDVSSHPKLLRATSDGIVLVLRRGRRRGGGVPKRHLRQSPLAIEPLRRSPSSLTPAHIAKPGRSCVRASTRPIRWSVRAVASRWRWSPYSGSAADPTNPPIPPSAPGGGHHRVWSPLPPPDSLLPLRASQARLTAAAGFGEADDT